MAINALFAAQDLARASCAGEMNQLGGKFAALDRLMFGLRDDGSFEGTMEVLDAQLGSDPVMNKILIGLAINVAMISVLVGDVPLPPEPGDEVIEGRQLLTALLRASSLDDMMDALMEHDPVRNKVLIGLALRVAMIRAGRGDVLVPNQV